MNDETPVYNITAVTDFLSVPEDRLADCLHEFAIWLRMRRDMAAMPKAISDLLGGKIAVTPQNADVFGWIDDGKNECTIVGVTDAGEEVMRTVLPLPERKS